MASDKKNKNVATIHISRDSKKESKDGSGESLVYRVLDKAEKIARTVATISKVLFRKPDKKEMLSVALAFGGMLALFFIPV